MEDGQQGGCINNFVEIDGQRICGCKTNFVYETLWGYEPKVIRMRSVAGQFASPQGFVFDVIQEACPFKVQQGVQPLRVQQVPQRVMVVPQVQPYPEGYQPFQQSVQQVPQRIVVVPQSIQPLPQLQQSVQPREKRFILHKLLKAHHQDDYELFPALKQIKTDIDEKFQSKFFQPNGNGFINNVCLMNHIKLFQMKLETIGIPKQYCFPSFY
jgi:hypothetical protein